MTHLAEQDTKGGCHGRRRVLEVSQCARPAQALNGVYYPACYLETGVPAERVVWCQFKSMPTDNEHKVEDRPGYAELFVLLKGRRSIYAVS